MPRMLGIITGTKEKQKVINWRTYELLKKEYLANRTKESLNNIRYWLDMNGMKMPKPRYIYDEKDVRTWKFLPDGELNPMFIY